MNVPAEDSPPRRAPPPVPPSAAVPGRGDGADTRHAGTSIDEGKGRVFPCEECGADLRFHIGEQSLACPHCGTVKRIALGDDARIAEQDFHATLERAAELRERRLAAARDSAARDSAARDRAAEPAQEITCDSCGATVRFVGSLVATACAFCGQPVQVSEARQAEEAIPVDGVLPFQVERAGAEESLRRWVKSRWFAPNAFRQVGVRGKLSGVYLPFWTFDSLTFNHYRGERGEHYWVTVGVGKNKSRQRRTRWYPAAGSFQRFFDDVLVVATASLRGDLLAKLEPWPLRRCLPFDPRLLAGFLARRYDVDLDEGFVRARALIDAALREDVMRRIGGDEQRIHRIDSRYDAITFKLLLLPVWSVGYRYKEKRHQVVINAVTGEVQGTRPWSFWKIFFAVLGGLGLIGAIGLIIEASS